MGLLESDAARGKILYTLMDTFQRGIVVAYNLFDLACTPGHRSNSRTPSNSIGPNFDLEFITKIVPYVTLLNRFYTYYVLYRVYSAIEQNHKLSWPVLLYIIIFCAVPCCLDYFQLISDA